MRHLWQQTLATISHHNGIYIIHNTRDYHRQSEHTAKQQYASIEVNLSKIKSCRLYQSTFGYKHVLAHYMIWFIYDDENNEEHEIILSIEARRPKWEPYTLWKGIIPWMYSIIYTRGTPSDLLWLRKNIWHDPLHSYDLSLNNIQVQNLFIYYVHRTNNLLQKPIFYHAVWYNCLTDLHRWLSHSTNILYPVTLWTVVSKWYVWYLQRMGIIKNNL